MSAAGGDNPEILVINLSLENGKKLRYSLRLNDEVQASVQRFTVTHKIPSKVSKQLLENVMSSRQKVIEDLQAKGLLTSVGGKFQDKIRISNSQVSNTKAQISKQTEAQQARNSQSAVSGARLESSESKLSDRINRRVNNTQISESSSKSLTNIKQKVDTRKDRLQVIRQSSHEEDEFEHQIAQQINNVETILGFQSALSPQQSDYKQTQSFAYNRSPANGGTNIRPSSAVKVIKESSSETSRTFNSPQQKSGEIFNKLYREAEHRDLKRQKAIFEKEVTEMEQIRLQKVERPIPYSDKITNRLYYAALTREEVKRLSNQKFKAVLDIEEQTQYTFKPHISKVSCMLAEAKGERKQKPLEDYLMDKGLVRKSKIEQAAAVKLGEEMEYVREKPKINQLSKELAMEKSRQEGKDHMSRHE